jgi:prevent-host-death family protein
MVNLTEDIHPLTDFKRNTSTLVKRMKKSKRPLVLTVNGKAEMVVQDAESYQRLLARVDEIETIEALRRGLQDVEAGRVTSLDDAVQKNRKKHGL